MPNYRTPVYYRIHILVYMGVSKNRGGTPKSSIFNRVFHEINHPFLGTTIFGNTLVERMVP